MSKASILTTSSSSCITVIFLIGSALLIFIREFNNHAISSTANLVPAQIMNEHCLTQGTFIETSLPNDTHKDLFESNPYEKNSD